jgi:hypothetical protein
LASLTKFYDKDRDWESSECKNVLRGNKCLCVKVIVNFAAFARIWELCLHLFYSVINDILTMTTSVLIGVGTVAVINVILTVSN